MFFTVGAGVTCGAGKYNNSGSQGLPLCFATGAEAPMEWNYFLNL